MLMPLINGGSWNLFLLWRCDIVVQFFFCIFWIYDSILQLYVAIDLSCGSGCCCCHCLPLMSRSSAKVEHFLLLFTYEATQLIVLQ